MASFQEKPSPFVGRRKDQMGGVLQHTPSPGSVRVSARSRGTLRDIVGTDSPGRLQGLKGSSQMGAVLNHEVSPAKSESKENVPISNEEEETDWRALYVALQQKTTKGDGPDERVEVHRVINELNAEKLLSKRTQTALEKEVESRRVAQEELKIASDNARRLESELTGAREAKYRAELDRNKEADARLQLQARAEKESRELQTALRSAESELHRTEADLVAQRRQTAELQCALDSEQKAKYQFSTALAEEHAEHASTMRAKKGTDAALASESSALAREQQENFRVLQDFHAEQKLRLEAEARLAQAALDFDEKSGAMADKIADLEDALRATEMAHVAARSDADAAADTAARATDALRTTQEELRVAKALLTSEREKTSELERGMEEALEAVEQTQQAHDLLERAKADLDARHAELKEQCYQTEQACQLAQADQRLALTDLHNAVDRNEQLEQKLAIAQKKVEDLTSGFRNFEADHNMAMETAGTIERANAAALNRDKQEMLSVEERLAAVDNRRVAVESALRDEQNEHGTTKETAVALGAEVQNLRLELTEVLAQKDVLELRLLDEMKRTTDLQAQLQEEHDLRLATDEGFKDMQQKMGSSIKAASQRAVRAEQQTDSVLKRAEQVEKALVAAMDEVAETELELAYEHNAKEQAEAVARIVEQERLQLEARLAIQTKENQSVTDTLKEKMTAWENAESTLKETVEQATEAAEFERQERERVERHYEQQRAKDVRASGLPTPPTVRVDKRANAIRTRRSP